MNDLEQPSPLGYATDGRSKDTRLSVAILRLFLFWLLAIVGTLLLIAAFAWYFAYGMRSMS